MRGSPPRTAASRSRAIWTLASVEVVARSSRHRSISGGTTPSGLTRPAHSSGSAKVALSRASASVSARTAGSKVPAEANPIRPSRITRMPTPKVSAEVKASTSPS